jgi:hypothetical protein
VSGSRTCPSETRSFAPAASTTHRPDAWEGNARENDHELRFVQPLPEQRMLTRFSRCAFEGVQFKVMCSPED